MTQNTNPAEGGPSGGQLEAKIGAYYFLSMLAECEPRGLPGCVATSVKFQRGYEGHALDDIIVSAEAADGAARTLEVQAKRTINFTSSDPVFGKVIRQVVAAGGEHGVPLAIAIARTSTKIERHDQQLLLLARKTSACDALRRALEAPRVVSQEMRNFAAAVRAQLVAAGGEATDEALWRLLRRIQILVFDFESPGALSTALVDALARNVLDDADSGRYRDLWEALQAKALSYDADGGEITRNELVDWLRTERGLGLRPGRDLKIARRRFGDASDAALAAIDDTVAGFYLDRSDRVLAAADQLDGARFLEIVGSPGCGKSAILKALAGREGIEGRPLVLNPARTPSGGWLALSTLLGFQGSATEFLIEAAASGCTTLYVDSLDRVTEAGAQATIVDLVWAVAKTPSMRLVVTVGSDFTDEQRAWLPAGAITILGHATTIVGPLSEDEAAVLAAADRRLAQLLQNAQAKPLTRNLYQLRQLLGRAETDLPVSEAALARSWWAAAPRLGSVENRARQKALRNLAAQALAQSVALDISGIGAGETEDLVQVEDITEIFLGAKGLFRHDILRDWSGANLLIEQPERLRALPLSAPAPAGLARAVEIKARWCAEQADGADQWMRLLAEVSENGVHGSWRRVVLLALVRTEPSIAVLDGLLDVLQADDGDLLRDLIRITEAADSASGVEHFAALGIDAAKLPTDLRTPTGPSWARLMGWLLTRLDLLTTPIGPDILRFFRLWLTATGGRDRYAPLIVQTLYEWLIALERQDRRDEATSFSRLFAYDGRYGRGRHIVQDIRTLFLIFCGSRPDLAESYLRNQLGEHSGWDVTDEILELPQALATAAPAAMADFTIDALITAEERYDEDHGPLPMGRLSLRSQERRGPGPSRGPYLQLLRASKADGLRLIRRIVDYGLHLDQPSNEPVQQFELDLQGGSVAVTVPNAYFVARSPGVNGVMASALRALESWGHEQIERGEPVEGVISDIIGGDHSSVAAPMLAVVVDLLLSHISAPDPRLIPYIASPELLRLDFDRFNRDRTGVHTLTWEDEGLSGPGSNADLAARPSRQTCLQWEAPRFLLAGESADLADLRTRLQRQLDRFPQGADAGPDGPYGLRWTVEHVLRLLDRANWRQAQAQLADGRSVIGLEYVEPESEAAVLEPLRASSNADLSESVVMSQAVEAAIDPSKATEDVVARGLEWARRQDPADVRHDEDDFTVAQRRRAVVATAVLAIRSAGDGNLREWATTIVSRAAIEPDDDHGAFGMGQVRYSAPGLAVLGLTHLAIEGEPAALSQLLELAIKVSPSVVAAFGLVMDDLARWRIACAASLLRLALDASTMSVRDWDHPERFQDAQARRAKRLGEHRSEEERFLLAGGPEPDWPTPARARHLSARRRLSPSPDRAERERDVRDRWGGRPPTASKCQSGGVEHHSKEASVGEVSTIGLDLAKSVFQAHGADASGAVVFRKKLRRDQLLPFFAELPRCVVAMEACAGAHHWARELAALGHEPRLIAPPYVKPFVKRQKNDMADAEAICEAAQRPTMRFVQPKSAEQQAAGTVFRTRDLLVRQRTQLINALRGHLTEFGMVVRKGVQNTSRLIAYVMDPTSDLLPETRSVLKVLAEALQQLEEKIAVLDVEIRKRARTNALAKRLMTIPGVGPVLATAMVAQAPAPETFRRGRDFAAWLGLTPLQHSSGGKERLGRTSKMGDRNLRRLLIIGASSAAKAAAAAGMTEGWLGRMLTRKPRMLVVVALANKTARIIWALMAHGGFYRAPAAAV